MNNKIWQVAKFEYFGIVSKKSFILVLLSLPALIIFSVGMGLFMESLREKKLPIGIVEEDGAFKESQYTQVYEGNDIQEMTPEQVFIYPDRAAAQLALENRQIQAFFILPAHYSVNRQVEVVYQDRPESKAWQQFTNYLQERLLQTGLPADFPAQRYERILGGSEVIVRSIDRSRAVYDEGPTFGLMMPLFICLAFLIMLLISSGFMLGSLTDEKENRTLEVLYTSLDPFHLMAGKVIGILAVSMTILLVWAGVVLLAIFIATLMGIDWFKDMSMDWRSVLVTLVVAIPAYALFVSLMSALGAVARTNQEGQSISIIFFILHMIPLYIAWSFINNPHGNLPVIMSMLPFTALMTLGMRNLFTIVPAWQVVISLSIQSVCAIGAVWLAGRAVHYGMQNFDQRIRWDVLFRSKHSHSKGPSDG
jgi:ABC-2 type transport system permease protein